MDERVQKYEQKMTKTLDGFEAELTTIRAGRANPHILDKITVDYYGSPTPLQQVANITNSNLGCFSFFLYVFYKIFTTFFRQFRQNQAHDLTIVARIQSKI